MCDVSGCSSEVGSGSVSDDGRDAMLDILDEFQRLYQGRMARLERDPAAPSYSKEKMELLEDWIGDLNQQNRTLVETVKELETEASQRCEMLESRLVSTTSSTKQYMLQLHQLQRQVQQLMTGRLQAETRAGEMTSLVDQLTADNEQLRLRLQPPRDAPLPVGTGVRWQHWSSRLTLTAGDSDDAARPLTDQTGGGDVTGHVQRLKADLRAALRDREDLQEILDIRKCELEESQSEVAGLRSELDRLKSTLGTGTAAGPAAGTGRRQLEPPAEVHRLQKHCRDLVDQRNEALAELAKVKVTLMEVMEQQVEDREETADDSSVSESDVISEQDVTKPPQLSNGRPPQLARHVVRRLPTNQSQAQRLENQLEERDQLTAALQGHLASARNEVALKDETLARLETKLEVARHDLSVTTERLAGADGERAALKQQNQIVNKQVTELQQRADEAAAVSRRLESEADQQMAQITDLQERLLAAETSNKELTAKCVQKDVEIGRQWTTISSLQEALLEAKQQIEALQPAPSFLGSLLGGGGIKKQTEETKKLQMDLAVAKSQFKETFSESAKQASALERLREENRQLGETVTRLRSEVAMLQAMTHAQPEPTGSEPGSDVALIEAMFEQLQTDLCGLADTLSQGRAPGQGHSAVLADQGTQTEQEADTDHQDWQTVGCCEHQLQLTQQRDVNEYLRRLLRKRAAGAVDLTPSLEREVSQLSEENRLWRHRVSQGQRQLTDLRHSLHSLRDGVEQCKKEETLVSELRHQLKEARRQLQLQSAVSQQLAQLHSQVDQLIGEKQHQHAMIRELRSELAASGDEATAAQQRSRAQQAEAARLTEQLAEQHSAGHKLSQQVQQLTAEHADCAGQRGRLEARLAEAHAQLAETLCGQDQVHSQADLIVDHVSVWGAEWRAENQRLACRVDQQTETITALQLENRHLSDRLALLCAPTPCSLPPNAAGSASAAEHYSHSLMDRYPVSFTDGCEAGPAPAPQQHRHSLSEDCPTPARPTRRSATPSLARPSTGGPPSLSRSVTGGPPSLARPYIDGPPSLGRPVGRTGCAECATPQSVPAAAASGTARRGTDRPVSAGDDHVPTRDSDRGWPGQLLTMVAEMHDRRQPQPSWRGAQQPPWRAQQPPKQDAWP